MAKNRQRSDNFKNAHEKSRQKMAIFGQILTKNHQNRAKIGDSKSPKIENGAEKS